MNISAKICIIDIKCDECRKVLKADTDKRIGIVTKYSKQGLLLCEDCFNELVKKVGELSGNEV